MKSIETGHRVAGTDEYHEQGKHPWQQDVDSRVLIADGTDEIAK